MNCQAKCTCNARARSGPKGADLRSFSAHPEAVEEGSVAKVARAAMVELVACVRKSPRWRPPHLHCQLHAGRQFPGQLSRDCRSRLGRHLARQTMRDQRSMKLPTMRDQRSMKLPRPHRGAWAAPTSSGTLRGSLHRRRAQWPTNSGTRHFEPSVFVAAFASASRFHCLRFSGLLLWLSTFFSDEAVLP